MSSFDLSKPPELLISPEEWPDFCEWASDGGYDQSYFNRWDSKSLELQRQYLIEKREEKCGQRRMSSEEFKAEVIKRGWTYRALAKRWGVTVGWISRVARNEDRAPHWNDAVLGLPTVVREKSRRKFVDK